MNIFINSYLPIQHTKFGRQALNKYKGLHPLEDGSIRREPDFKNERPGISGLCRPGAMKSINLSPGDIIVYKTTRSHLLAAILEISVELSSHNEAQAWYKQNKLPVPSNCILAKNIGVEQSHANGFLNYIKNYPNNIKSIENMWDLSYQKRAKSFPYFFITKPIYNAVLNNIIEANYINIEDILRTYFNGSLPPTQKIPAKLSLECYNEILLMINNHK